MVLIILVNILLVLQNVMTVSISHTGTLAVSEISSVTFLLTRFSLQVIHLLRVLVLHFVLTFDCAFGKDCRFCVVQTLSCFNA